MIKMFVCGTKEEKLVCWLNKRRKQVEFSLEPYTRENRYRLEFLKGDIYRLLFSSFIKEDVVVEFVCDGRKKLIDYLQTKNVGFSEYDIFLIDDLRKLGMVQVKNSFSLLLLIPIYIHLFLSLESLFSFLFTTTI